MDVIPNTSLIKMPKSLAKFPTQAICCSLAKVSCFFCSALHDLVNDQTSLNYKIGIILSKVKFGSPNGMLLLTTIVKSKVKVHLCAKLWRAELAY